MSDLRELARPFPDSYVHSNPSGGGSYVKHHVIVQRLLQVVGHYDFELVQVIRGDVAAIAPNPQANSRRGKEGSPALTNAVVGAVCRLTVTYDGKTSRIEDVGDCEQPHNWPTDGARLKDAMSDAIKRCAARIGLGLHLWSQDEYFLPAALDKDAADLSTSHEAASQLELLRVWYETVTQTQRTRDEAAEDAERLYRREQARAVLIHKDDAKNAAVLEALVTQHAINADASAESGLIQQKLGLGHDPCRTVGELRYLRGLAVGMADRAKQAVRDAASFRSAWQSVAGMAKVEAQFVQSGGAS